METRIQKEFIDHGFGFPVRLRNVPMVKVRREWTPNLNYDHVARAVLQLLAFKASRLSGNEIKFIRTHFEMTLHDFSKRLDVSHVAVLKWERAKNQPTAMNWSTEKDIRLFILSKLRVKSVMVVELYSKLEAVPNRKPASLDLDVEKIAA